MNEKESNSKRKQTADEPNDNVADPAPIPRESQQVKPNSDGNGGQNRKGKGWPNRIQAIFTSLIFVATTAYVIVSYLQWGEMQRTSKATEDAVKVTKEAIQLTEAADIEGERFICSPDSPMLSQDSSVMFTLKNSGRTRAEKVEVVFTLGIPGRPLRTDPREKPKPVTIGPGHTFKTQSVIVRDNIRGNDWEEIVADRAQLHFRGHASYRDVFGNHHCFMWDSFYIPKTKCDFGMTNIYNTKECPKDDLNQQKQ